MVNHRPSMKSDEPPSGLTLVPGPKHGAVTPEAIESIDELDLIVIDHFVDTLAAVAMAVIRRRQQPGQ